MTKEPSPQEQEIFDIFDAGKALLNIAPLLQSPKDAWVKVCVAASIALDTFTLKGALFCKGLPTSEF